MKFKIIKPIILVIIWMLIIFLFSNTNSTLSNNESKGILKNIAENVTEYFNLDLTREDINNFVNMANYPARKIMHFSVYFILSLLILNVFKAKDNKYKYLITLLICFLYAISDEFHQRFVSGRTGQIFDVFVDTTGSCLGMLIYYLITSKKTKKKCKK